MVLASAVALGPLAGSVASPVYAQAKAVHAASSPAGHKPFCIGYTPAKVCLSWTGATVTATWTGDKWAKTERLVALQARPVKAGQPGKVLPGPAQYHFNVKIVNGHGSMNLSSPGNVRSGEYRVTAYLSVPYTKPTPNIDVETFIGPG